MRLRICTMAREINFDQTCGSLNYNSDSDPDFDTCGFYTRDNKAKKIKKPSRRSSSPIAGSSENALSDCFEESSVVQNQEVKNVVLVDSAVQVTARNFPRKKSAIPGTTRVTRSKKKSNEFSLLLETMPEIEEVSSQSVQVDETMNEPLLENLETSETSLEPQRGPEKINNLHMQCTVEGLTSSMLSLEIPSISGLNSSNNENHAENPSENQEIKKTLILNITLSNAGNNMNQPFSIAIPMDDKVETLNIALNPENMEMAKQINKVPSTSNEKKKVKITFDSDHDEKKSHKKKSKRTKKYSKKRSKYYSSDSECSCSNCLSSSSYYTSSSEDECCRKHCSCSRKDVKEKSSKKNK